MKILVQYLRPYKWLVILVMVLASINIGFSLIDPIIFGKLINLASYHQQEKHFTWNDSLFINKDIPRENVKLIDGAVVKFNEIKSYYGIVWLLLASISVAMIS